jgi:hypothetical protein
MRRKSVWLHKPFGNPKKTLFSVSEEEISLREKVFPAGEVVGCKRNYAKPFLKPINIVITFGLLCWTFYEMASVFLRLGILIALDMQPDADVARVNENLQNMLQSLHLRASTTDDQQLQLFLALYFSTILYGLIFSNLIFRPRIVLTLKNGDTVEVPFLFVRPRKFANALRAGHKVSKRTRKSIKRDKKSPELT